MAPPARYAANKSCDMGFIKPKKGEIMDEPKDGLDLQIGSTVIGTIDGKIDEGYLITVYIGTEEYTGVLYHVPYDDSEDNVGLAPHPGQNRSRMEFMDSDSSESNTIGYNIFFVEQYALMTPLYHMEESAIIDEIGVMWNNLNELEKKMYEEREMRFNFFDNLV